MAGTKFFWLDLDDAAADGTVAELLSVHFKFHPLAVESAERFNQRPRIDDYDGFIYLVARGADPEHTGQAEVHCFWTDRYVVTVHRGWTARRWRRSAIASIATTPRTLRRRRSWSCTSSSARWSTASSRSSPNSTTRSTPSRTTSSRRRPKTQLGQLFDMKRSLIDMRKVIAPQRDMMASINSGVDRRAGMTDEATRYFRDLYDHLIRLADLVDSYRDLSSSVMDTHLSTVSNRLNVVMKQLTIIATIFLPLSFLTGFFGQNFAYLVRVWHRADVDLLGPRHRPRRWRPSCSWWRTSGGGAGSGGPTV